LLEGIVGERGGEIGTETVLAARGTEGLATCPGADGTVTARDGTEGDENAGREMTVPAPEGSDAGPGDFCSVGAITELTACDTVVTLSAGEGAVPPAVRGEARDIVMRTVTKAKTLRSVRVSFMVPPNPNPRVQFSYWMLECKPLPLGHDKST